MADNSKLMNAKKVKNDEFYTEYSTISNEMGHYREQLKGQIVYCNCDDPSWSNFWKYFHSNFSSLGLKKLIATHYQKDSEPSYALIYEGGNDFDMDSGKILEIRGNVAIVNGKEIFYTAGDFRSDACDKLMEEATVISTNPPFSLFNQYLQCLVKSGKKFIILGNQNASHNKEIFPLFKNNVIWYGASIHSGGVDFRMPDDYDEYGENVFIKDGHHYINLAGIRWFTNLGIQKRHEPLVLYKNYNPEEYPKYDNYDAINVDKVKDIPCDYDGIMGVPITFLDKYNPDQFEIIGLLHSSTDEQAGIPNLRYYNDFKEMKQDMSYTGSSGGKANGNPVVKGKALKGNFLYNPETDEYVHSLYTRVLIRKRK